VQARNWASGPLRATLGIFWELLLARRRERRSAAQSPIALRNSLQNVLNWANVLLGRRSDRIGVSGRRTAMIDGSSAWIAETRHGISGLRTANRLATIFSRIEMNAGTTSKALARIARAGVIKIEKTGSSIERIYGKYRGDRAEEIWDNTRDFYDDVFDDRWWGAYGWIGHYPANPWWWWAPAAFGTVAAFVDGITPDPIYIDYGVNVTFEDDAVYVDNQPVSVEEYNDPVIDLAANVEQPQPPMPSPAPQAQYLPPRCLRLLKARHSLHLPALPPKNGCLWESLRWPRRKKTIQPCFSRSRSTVPA
jgi:hypothetical protein